MDDVPFVSVVIPVFNDGDRLTKCLNALYHQSYPYSRYEVIVVDNNSTEDIRRLCQFPNVRYCQESKPGSYAARNRGLQMDKGTIIAFTDSDCIPHSDWISAGVRSLQSHPQAGIIGGHIQFFFESSKPSPAEYADSCFYLQQQVYVSRDHYAATANAFVRRTVIDQVGAFDDRFLNMGDKEFGQRVYAAHWDVVFCAESVVFHPARTMEALLIKVHRQTRAGKKLHQLKNSPLPKCSFLPLGLRFLRTVCSDDNLSTWKEKVAFIWVMHWLKWAAAWELLCCFRDKRVDSTDRTVTNDAS